MDVAETNGVKSHFYFIPGHSGEKGTDYDIRDSEVVRRAQHIARRGHVVGMHAGYDSYNNASIFAREYSRLAAIVPSPIEGRQHYLRFENPTTWEIWNQRGMKVDSTVGYNFHVGFRSGVCYPYPVFNIIERRKLELRERPLVVMDNPARRISNNGVEFENLVIELAQIVYQYGGAFVLLWHNNNFHDHGWDEYAKHYETIVNRLTGLKDNNK